MKRSRPGWLVGLGLQAACAAAVPPAASTCRIAAEHAALRDIPVEAGSEQFSVSLEDARVSLTATAQPAELEVYFPLRFRTRHSLRGVPLRVGRQVELHEGRLAIGAGSRPDWLGVRGDHMLVSLEPNLALRVDPAPALACSDLTIAGKDFRYASPKRDKPVAARFVGFGSNAMRLFVDPGVGDALSVEYSGPFEVVGEKPGWLRVRASWEDGSRIEGWTPEEPGRLAAAWPGVSVDGGSTGGGCSVVDERPPLRVEVQSGSAVAARPEGPVWAHFATDQKVEALALPEFEGWLAVVAMAGVARPVGCADAERIWVRVRDVR